MQEDKKTYEYSFIQVQRSLKFYQRFNNSEKVNLVYSFIFFYQGDNMVFSFKVWDTR